MTGKVAWVIFAILRLMCSIKILDDLLTLGRAYMSARTVSPTRWYARCFSLANLLFKTERCETAARDPYTRIRIAENQNSDITKCRGGCGATGTLIHCRWERQVLQPLWKVVWQFLTLNRHTVSHRFSNHAR